MGLDGKKVALEKYNTQWEKEFLDEKNVLLNHLNQYIDDIQHVGSTSIQGLKAKPIIDIAISLKEWNKKEDLCIILNTLNYEYRPNAGTADRLFFAKGAENNRTHYLHVCRKNCQEWYNLIYFRDYLINHETVKQEYQLLKEELAKKYPDDRNSYCNGKNDFIKSIIKLQQEKRTE